MTKGVAHLNTRAEVLSSHAVTMLLTKIRAKSTTQREFVAYADRLMNILAEEALSRLATQTTVTTPCGEFDGLEPPSAGGLCCVDIIRSGGILLEAVRKLCPDCKTAKILIQRDEETALPRLFYSKLPAGVQNLQVLLTDPMLATGGSALTAINVLKQAGVREEDILFVNVVAAPQGLQTLAEQAPGVRILSASVDDGLDERKYIVPGLGDFGDRYYGTAGYMEGLWGTDSK
uniref:uracil phosphoribosyltransferase n=1 Tax=Alexandrium catenella TaxID=2925 RepID=A0A7S1MCD4_ALECA|mmetsp:Transcript_23855/g.64991  ORF Transcript_23855/g.64991 Transcript_23855/m.64991 type:complete len:232 (+) Transcript_23855:47-742(+)